MRMIGTGHAGLRIETGAGGILRVEYDGVRLPHGWMFDLPTRRCLNSVGHALRTSLADGGVAGG